jgi:hypothetical protein
MSSSPEMQQMRAHGDLFKLAGLHGNSGYNNNTTTLVAKETQEFKTKRNLPLSTLSNREQFF